MDDLKNKTSALTQVRFYGHLRAKFGEGHRMDVNSPARAIYALGIVMPGFAQHMREHSLPGYRVIVEDIPIEEDEELYYPAVGKIIRIVPVVAGAAGLGKILTGAALIGLSFTPLGAVSLGALGSIGSLATSLGISNILGASSGDILIKSKNDNT